MKKLCILLAVFLFAINAFAQKTDKKLQKKVEELLKGFKICKQAYARYEEDFIEREDPHGRRYYWLTGEFVNFDKGKDTDVWALANNYVSVVPVQFDLTNYVLKDQLQKEWLP